MRILKPKPAEPIARRAGESWESVARRRAIDHVDLDYPEPMNMKNSAAILAVVLLWIGILGFAALLIFTNTACAHARIPQHSALSTQHPQTPADYKKQAALDAARTEANPVRHPFAAARQVVIHVRVPLEVAASLAFIALLIGVGLTFVTAFSWIGKIVVPVAASVAIGCLTGLLVLPFLPWILLGLAAVAAAALVYEWRRYKSLKSAARAVITDFHEVTTGTAAPAGSAAAPLVAPTA